jgi:hypothetical protein
MKTATIPPLCVAPELRQAVEDVLHENESLSAFIEAALREGVARRRLQREFVACGLASREPARLDNEYCDADDVHAGLGRMLKVRRKAQ